MIMYLFYRHANIKKKILFNRKYVIIDIFSNITVKLEDIAKLPVQYIWKCNKV